MSDDLVKQAIAELQDLVRCCCHPAYKDRGLHDPNCECDSAEAVRVVADRIEELEKELEYWRRDSAAGWDKCAEYRNKVEKVVEDAFFAGFSEGCDGTWVDGDPTPAFKEYLAELKGEK